jgi:hypothetical protein
MTKTIHRLVLAVVLALPFAQLHAKSDQVWSDGFHDYIRLQTADAGANNAHPAAVTHNQVKVFMKALQIKDSDDDLLPLFSPDEENYLSDEFAKGLKQANATQDLIFFSTARRGSFIVGPKGANTGRMFVADGALHLIIGEAHEGYAAKLKAQGRIPDFSFGSRTKAGKIALHGTGITYPGGDSRRDWVAMSLSDTAPKAAETPAAPAKSEPAPATPAPVDAAPVPAPAARDAKFYAQQEERLRRLQDLRKKGLITDKEFEAKKQEILKDY